MIVTLRRDDMSYFVEPHSQGEATWMSPGAYVYLLAHTDYRVFEMHRVSFYLVERMLELGHMRPMKQAPPLGEFLDEFQP
ncbi:MAG: hypothetical protein B7Z80_19545 [Rhodospirillales bacterium 20-64-7]|nr:MAG: hypothetical protein B7Z80_19545 [Rhodospirillales bacterium 20-64-7]